MIKNIVLQHQQEKEELLARQYVQREQLNEAKKLLKTDLIKVITGPRRAGKSVFSSLLLKDKKFAYLNFDDEGLLKIKDYDQIIQTLGEVYHQPDFYFFDEIQNLADWEVFVNKLQRRGYNLILTGSNAKLLSQELASSLTGRHLPLEILPFSFREFLSAKDFVFHEKDMALPEKKASLLNYLDKYLSSGGFPEVVVKDLEAKTYLKTLFDAVLLKDVVQRHRVRFSQKIYDLATYLAANFACQFTFNKLRNTIEFGSVKTVQDYLGYLEAAYLTLSLNRFSFKTKEQIRAPRKAYLVDNGFIFAKSFQFSPNIGRLMENLVLVELLRRGHRLNEGVFYYQTRNRREVDFVIKKGSRIQQLIQVCYQIDEPETKKREIKSLFEASEELNCQNLLVLTQDFAAEEEIKKKKIKFRPLWQWLLTK